MPPASDGGIKEVVKIPFFGVDSQGLALEPEDDNKEVTPVVWSPVSTVPSERISSDDQDELTERIMEEKQRLLEDVARSQGADPYPAKPGRWVPQDEMEANAELRQAQALDEHTDLQLETEVAARTIHILGTGPTGKFIAHALAGLSDAPPVTLLMHRPLLMQNWHEEGASIQVLGRGQIDKKSNFHIESSWHFQRVRPGQRFPGFGQNLEYTAEPPTTPIESLIVTTEGYITVAALSSIKHRLSPNSTICFIQDGLGMVERVNAEVFPDPTTRPCYMLGNMSHELLSTERKFTLFERKPGKMSLTITPRYLEDGSLNWDSRRRSLTRRLDYGWTPNSRWLMRTLSRTPGLTAVGLVEDEFYEMQLQKIAINSVIGPMSVIYNCLNDQLLCNYPVSRSMNLLIKEISTVLLALPEVRREARIDNRFSAETLEKVIIGVIGRTGHNSTSMLQAVRKGERTDIDFFNGYLIQRAMERKIDCPHLEMMVAIVKGKQLMKKRDNTSLIPFKV